ncbi:MAG: hypothetical protein AB7E55_03285 [Pigmentiphaga sp.]
MLPATQCVDPNEPIPLPWAARLIERLQALYGAQFSRQWESVPAERLALVWAEELAGYTAAEIRLGLDACRTQKFPPTLPEFLLMCRPALDPATAYQAAVVGLEARRRGEQGEWPHPAVFWAAVKVGQHDMLHIGWNGIRSRWESVLREQIAAGQWDPVPAPAIALVAPGGTRTSAEDARRRLRELAAIGIVNPTGDHKIWARKALERDSRGEAVPAHTLRAAREAMGVQP